jgi:hypothetical protein
MKTETAAEPNAITKSVPIDQVLAMVKTGSSQFGI